MNDQATPSSSNATMRDRFLHSEDGHIFAFGCCLLILWVESVAVMLRLGDPIWLKMVMMGLTHLLAGRAASIAQGTQAVMHPALISFFAVLFDTIVMLIMFPVMVFSYQNFFERRFFQKHMKPMFDQAQKGLTRLRKAKILGVFMFVWFPFWMTGVIAGSLLGYLLGLRKWVTMLTAVLGNIAAVLCWVYAYDKLFGWLNRTHQNLAAAATLLIILSLVFARLVWKRKEAEEKSVGV
ncbi:MAG: small multi-drug export protein [Lentisphaerae bacterium]|nr:small multi-drug export protein [Lentisphaerota bacterium]